MKDKKISKEYDDEKKIIRLLMVFVISFPLLFTPLQAEAQQRAQGQCFGQNAIDLYSNQRQFMEKSMFFGQEVI